MNVPRQSSPASPLVICIAAGSAKLRQDLGQCFHGCSDVQVAASSSSLHFLKNAIRRWSPHVVILDISLATGVSRARMLEFEKACTGALIPITTGDSGLPKPPALTIESGRRWSVYGLTRHPAGLSSTSAEQLRGLVRKHRPRVGLPKRRPRGANPSRPSSGPKQGVPSTSPRPAAMRGRGKLIVMGASTGGTLAIEEVLSGLRPNMSPILITQHIPGFYSGSFARRLDARSALTVVEARDGQALEENHVYVAPGECHLTLRREGLRNLVALDDGEPVNRHRPSVDVMFQAVAEGYRSEVLAVLLTGMGRDGAQGMRALHELGARTIAQDSSTSVVWSMPSAAIDLGAVDEVLPLQFIAQAIDDFVSEAA